MKKIIKFSLLSVAVVAALVASEMYFFSVCSRGTKPKDKHLMNHEPYSRVCIFGIDGSGGFMKDSQYKEFHEIFDKGAVRYDVMTQHLCDSAPNWFSIFHGVNYLSHHLGNSTSERAKEYFNTYPSFFVSYLNANPLKKAYSIVDWGTINSDLLEDHPNLVKIQGTGEGSENVDLDVKNQVIAAISTEDVGIMYMHFDQVDHAGHAYGNKSNEYKVAMNTVSSYIGEIYQKYVDLGYADDTLFIAVSDHGMDANGNHGGPLLSIRKSMVAVYGGRGDIRQGHQGFTVNQDVASIVLYGLGVKQPSSYGSKVPRRLFTTLK